ncbi:MAG TPA: hypothetical protein VMM83_00210 [Longimicrobiales bacterium]|nr:hypothetical protein [Longimicrobiales bacterium]
MGLFEVLIILVFIGLPLIEGILKQRRKGRAPNREAPARSTRPPPGADVEGSRGPRPIPRSSTPPADEGPAADMIPADLWEVLTGERRPTGPAPEEPVEEWVLAEEPASIEEATWVPPESDWGPSRWEMEQRDLRDAETREANLPEPASLEEEVGQVVSLEVLPPPPDVRHRLFHEKYPTLDAEAAAPARGLPYDLRAGLRGPGLRRAILLNEILGPPKGLA